MCNHAFAVDYQSDAEYRCVKCGFLMKELGLVITRKDNVTTVAGDEHCRGENANSTNEGLAE